MRNLLVFFWIALFLSACSRPPPPTTATDTARADELIKGHEREQLADIENAREAATILNVAGAVEALDRIKGRLAEFTKAIANLIRSIESKSAAVAKENARLKSQQYATVRALVPIGLIIAAAGVFLCFTPIGKIIGIGGILAGFALSIFAVAIELSIFWLKIAVPVVIGALVILIIVEMLRKWKSVVEIVRRNEIVSSAFAPSLAKAANAVGDGSLSESTKKIVEAAKKKIGKVRPVTKEQLDGTTDT